MKGLSFEINLVSLLNLLYTKKSEILYKKFKYKLLRRPNTR